MKLVVLIALAACSPPPRADTGFGPDAGAPDASAFDVAPPYVARRDVTAVVIGADHVTWSFSDEACPLEGGPCDTVVPTIRRARFDGTDLVTLASTWNRVTIAGDEAGAFFVNQDDWMYAFVARVPDSPTQLPQAISIPNSQLRAAPQVDDTYVYWFAGGGIYRAPRTSNGSDAVLVSDGHVLADTFRVLAGHIWWGTYDAVAQTSLLHRIPTDGGSEIVTDDLVLPVAAKDDIVYVSQRIGSGFTHYIIGAMTLDGVITPLLDIAQHEQPARMIVDGDTLYWSTLSGVIRRMPVTGGTPTDLIHASSVHFGLTSTSLLYNFNQDGFHVTSR